MKKTIKTTSSRLLEGIICCVDTRNEDGSDASTGTIHTLKSLGATVESGGIRMGLTHMIWSNGNQKHVQAAEFMDIKVVSPLWVEQCHESGKKVPEEDFIVNLNNLDAKKPVAVTKIREPIIGQASTLRSIDSPSLSSSQMIADQVHKVVLKDLNMKKRKGVRLEDNIENEVIASSVLVPSYREINGVKGKNNDSVDVITVDSSEKVTNNSNSVKKSSKEKKMSNNQSVNASPHGINDLLNNISPDSVVPKAKSKIGNVVSSKVDSSEGNKKRRQDDIVSSNNKKKKSDEVLLTTEDKGSVGDITGVMHVALSGFEGDERTMLWDILTGLIATHNNKDSMKLKNKCTLIDDGDESVPSLKLTTHVVAPKASSRRTLRVIFAMAKKVPIVTEDWVYASLESRNWKSVSDYLHPNFNSNKLLCPPNNMSSAKKGKGGSNTKSTSNTSLDTPMKLYIGPFQNPPRKFLVELVSTYPYTQLAKNLTDADYVIAENCNNFKMLQKSLLSVSSSEEDSTNSSEIISMLNQLQMSGHIIPYKTLFDHIQSGDSLDDLSMSKGVTAVNKSDRKTVSPKDTVVREDAKSSGNRASSNEFRISIGTVDSPSDERATLVLSANSRKKSPVTSTAKAKGAQTLKKIICDSDEESCDENETVHARNSKPFSKVNQSNQSSAVNRPISNQNNAPKDSKSSAGTKPDTEKLKASTSDIQHEKTSSTSIAKSNVEAEWDEDEWYGPTAGKKTAAVAEVYDESPSW